MSREGKGRWEGCAFYKSAGGTLGVDGCVLYFDGGNSLISHTYIFDKYMSKLIKL